MAKAETLSPIVSATRAEAKKKKKEHLLLGRLIQKIAPRIGAQVLLEPEWGIVGRITFKNGKISYFRYNTVDLNPVGASDIAKDKDYANYFMAGLGYPTIVGKTFFRPEWHEAIKAQGRTIDDAWEYAQSLGMPVIVKPNGGSQGRGVALVHTKTEFYRAAREAMRLDRVILVQEQVHGRDYRVVVLDDKVISAYERLPLSVVGNGSSTIAELLEEKQKQFNKEGRDTTIKPADPRIKDKLAREHKTLESVPAASEQVVLLHNANLSTGGDARDVTSKINPAFAELAIKLTRDMGLRLCGVDFMVDGDIADVPNKYKIIEINAAPGLDHYSRVGHEQEQIVEDLYLEVLKSIEKGA